MDIYTSEMYGKLVHIYYNVKQKMVAVKNTPGLVNWVDHNCHPELLTAEFSHKDILNFKIYNIIHPDIPIRCPLGKPLHYYSKRKLPVCTLSCNCWKDAADIKYKQSLMGKYGVDHISKVPSTIFNKNKNNMEKYGVEHTFQVSDFKDKSIATCLEKYGTRTTATVPEFIEKRKETNLSRYGVEYAISSPDIKTAIRKTVVEKYGSMCALQNPEVQKKTQQSMMDRYGTITPIHSDELRAKMETTNLEKYGVKNVLSANTVREAIKATTLLRYGFENVGASPEIKEKIVSTCLKKYGVSNFNQAHISSDSYEILNSKERFSEQLLTLGREDLAKTLGVSVSLISQYHKHHELSIISPNTSSYERELSNWLSNNDIGHQCGNRDICSPNELDIYLPSHNLAIEIDGLYWHSETMGKGRHYHILKTQQCAEKDIRLIHIFEDEWLQKKDICKNIIAMSLGICNNKIAARKCTIEIINNREIARFMNGNHLQGHCAAKVNIALKYNDEIVMAMTFSNPRYNKNIQWELLRLASLGNYQIVGGAEKLWSYFHKQYNPTSIVSYCDKRWFSGGIYTKLGFCQKAAATATYWYTDLKNRYHRSKFTKQRAIAAALKISNDYTKEELQELTEAIIMTAIVGMDRIWDCGQDTYIWKK